MAKFKVVLSDPDSDKVSVLELEGAKAQPLVGRQLGEEVDGSVLGTKEKARITGGTDKDGIPMRPGVHGGAKKYLLLAEGVGFKPERSGERRRKLVRGQMITDETYQLNMIVVRGGETVEAEAPKEEKPAKKKAPKPKRRRRKSEK